MKRTQKYTNHVLTIVALILFNLPVAANAAPWMDDGMHPNITPPARIEPPHQVAPAHVEPPHVVPARPVADQHVSPVTHQAQGVRHLDQPKDPLRRDFNYYRHYDAFNYSDLTPAFTVPDGFESVTVDGQSYYYNNGIFYQQDGNQLITIPPVLGAIVNDIPQDYVVISADGVNYLFTSGIYFVRTDDGFQVVQPPFVTAS